MDEKSKCNDGLYYTELCQTHLPCVHECLNKYWHNNDMLFLDDFWIDETEIDAIDGSEPVISIPDDELGPTIVKNELMNETF